MAKDGNFMDKAKDILKNLKNDHGNKHGESTTSQNGLKTPKRYHDDHKNSENSV